MSYAAEVGNTVFEIMHASVALGQVQNYAQVIGRSKSPGHHGISNATHLNHSRF